VAGLFLVVQQVEGNLVQPMVQRSVVEIPPVVTIAAVAVGGYLFGIIGLLVATPLVIVVITLINMLWLQDELGEERRFPDAERVPEPAPGEAAAELRRDGTPSA
jgi:predicted PurR-regulated permease PerM